MIPSSKRRTRTGVSLRVVGPADDRTVQAFVGHEYAGMAGYTLKKRCANVCNILVFEAFRRRGIGVKLYRTMAKEAAAAGASLLRAEITSEEGASLFRRVFAVTARVGQHSTVALR